MHKASYYACELNDSGRSAQYRSKSFIMTDSRCLRHKASYYACELNDSGRSAQYRSKSFIMTDSRCLRRFQWSWRMVQIFEAK